MQVPYFLSIILFNNIHCQYSIKIEEGNENNETKLEERRKTIRRREVRRILLLIVQQLLLLVIIIRRRFSDRLTFPLRPKAIHFQWILDMPNLFKMNIRIAALNIFPLSCVKTNYENK